MRMSAFTLSEQKKDITEQKKCKEHKMKTIDARGLSCPEPVIMTRKALSSGEQSYEVLVDNPASRENVTRYAEHQGYSVSVTEQDGEYTLSLRKA